MKSRELFDSGRLADAIAALNEDVRSKPADLQLRSFLFDLLCFDGNFERASKQLEVVAAQSGASAALAHQVYSGLIAGELERRRVLRGAGLPKFFIEPPQWLEPYMMLPTQLQRTPADARSRLDAAEAQPPEFAGTANGVAFSAFRDLDDRTPCVIEVLRGRDYLWLPFSEISRIEVTPPSQLRDLIWAHARIETNDGQTGDMFVPVLYADSDRHPDDLVKLGRATEWTDVTEGIVAGVGQRMFAADDRELGLLELRTIEFVHSPEGTASV